MGNSVTLTFIRYEQCALSKQTTPWEDFKGWKAWWLIGRDQGEIELEGRQTGAKMETYVKGKCTCYSLHDVNLFEGKQACKDRAVSVSRFWGMQGEKGTCTRFHKWKAQDANYILLTGTRDNVKIDRSCSGGKHRVRYYLILKWPPP